VNTFFTGKLPIAGAQGCRARHVNSAGQASMEAEGDPAMEMPCTTGQEG